MFFARTGQTSFKYIFTNVGVWILSKYADNSNIGVA